MKKLTCAILALLLLLGMTACSGTTAQQPSPDPDTSGKSEQPSSFLPDLFRSSRETLAESDVPPAAGRNGPGMEAILQELESGTLSDEEMLETYARFWDSCNPDAVHARRAAAALLEAGLAEPFLSSLQGFTTGVSGEVLSGTQNTVFSPANLFLAMAMLADATAGDTQAELLALLGTPDADTLHTHCRRIWAQLSRDSEELSVQMAGSVWLSNGLSVKPELPQLLADVHHASAYRIAMGSDEGNRALQKWLGEHTGGLLEESIQGLKTTPETLLALVTALYFEADWANAFSDTWTKPDTFFLADGSELTTDFMHTANDRPVIRVPGGTIADLPFADGLSMRFLLPDEDTTLETLLSDPAVLDAVTGIPGEGVLSEVSWSVPKFDVDTTVELKNVFRTLGITHAFDAEKGGDFSPVTDDAPLYVSTVRHGARLLIDEEGCLGAAYTAILMEPTSAPPLQLPPVEMNLNRPFLFVVTGLDGLPLFIGTVADPSL